MPSYETKIISTGEVTRWLWEEKGFTATTAILFSGDRIPCCDEAVGIYNGEQLVGLATIAPKGESGHDLPDIVGVFVDPDYRGQGLGVLLFEAAVRRCLERGFEIIHLDVLSSGMNATLQKIDPALRAHLKEVHHNFGGWRYPLDGMP